MNLKPLQRTQLPPRGTQGASNLHRRRGGAERFRPNFPQSQKYSLECEIWPVAVALQHQ